MGFGRDRGASSGLRPDAVLPGAVPPQPGPFGSVAPVNQSGAVFGKGCEEEGPRAEDLRETSWDNRGGGEAGFYQALTWYL